MPLNPAFNATQFYAALNHLEASHLIIGAETNLPWKEPRSNSLLLDGLTHRSNHHDPKSAAVPSLKEIIVVDNSEGRVELKPFRSVLHYNNVLEDGDSGGLILKADLDPGDSKILQMALLI